ncbi:hypothetical protein [Peribacillus frigoritolerans]|uniref:hypothetical protein n=1 Tax=Peribacillus frigoritolerans TaxID=450367 RepID=UPI00215B6B41|nr:hypothetical protein [Peribacillus frigoritolerans]MCR8867464.1 hypothetical protein [Peribacillus frigoritolerans]
MQKKLLRWGLFSTVGFFVVSFLWSVVGDVLLGPTKDLIESKVSTFLNSPPPGYTWAYVVPLIIIIGACIVSIVYMRQQLGSGKFNSSEVDIKEFMKNFTDKACRKQYVIATQLYRYNFKRSNYKIKVSYQDGYVVDDEKLNAIAQDYFEIERSLFNELKRGIEEVQKNDDYAKLNRFLLNCLQDLEASPTIQDVNKEIIQFSLFILGVQYVLNTQQGTNANSFLGPNRIVRILSNASKEAQLYTLARTGLMRAVLNTELNLSSLYCFEHMGDGDKAGRVYLTLNVLRKGEPNPYIFLITVSPRIEDEQDQNQMLSDILEDFVNQMEKELDIEEIQNLRLVV